MPNIGPDLANMALSKEQLAVLESMRASVPYPTLICGASRKANVGNFETTDVFAAINIPILYLPQLDLAEFDKNVQELAEYGFQVVSREVGTRYRKIKGLDNEDE